MIALLSEKTQHQTYLDGAVVDEKAVERGKRLGGSIGMMEGNVCDAAAQATGAV